MSGGVLKEGPSSITDANIQSVTKSLEGQIQVIGIHYTAASELSCELNEKNSRFQIDHFLKTGEWLSQTDILLRMPAQNTNFSH